MTPIDLSAGQESSQSTDFSYGSAQVAVTAGGAPIASSDATVTFLLGPANASAASDTTLTGGVAEATYLVEGEYMAFVRNEKLVDTSLSYRMSGPMNVMPPQTAQGAVDFPEGALDVTVTAAGTPIGSGRGTVYVYRADGTPVTSHAVSTGGKYVFLHMPPGTYSVVATYTTPTPDEAGVQHGLVVANGQSTTATVNLP